MLAQQLSVLSIVCGVLAPIAVFARGAGSQLGTPESEVPTAIEQALIERSCGPALEAEARDRCLRARHVALRADFGRDLSRLSVADRRTLDAACSRVRAAEGRDAYLDCLGAQLVAVRNRRNRARPAVSEVTAPTPVAVIAPFVDSAPPARRAWSSGAIVGAAVASVLTVAGVALAVVRSRRPQRTCPLCAADVPHSGGLCPACQQAAEALRRAAAERAQQQKAQEEDARQQREQQAELREQQAREQEAARRRQQEEARQLEEAARRREEDERRRSEDERRRLPEEVLATEDGTFDPYAILGVARETSPEAVHAAYQQAKSKYDLDLVEHMGDEVREHFRVKAQAIDAAYQMITATPVSVPGIV